MKRMHEHSECCQKLRKLCLKIRSPYGEAWSPHITRAGAQQRRSQDMTAGLGSILRNRPGDRWTAVGGLLPPFSCS